MTLRCGLYQHYKGPLYRVTQVVTHSETDEPMVVYQALYGDKGFWTRPLAMFIETVRAEGELVPRFRFLEPQAMVLELAVLTVKPPETEGFEKAFAQAEPIIKSMDGYFEHQLRRHSDTPNQYLLTVKWQSKSHHQDGFRTSPEYQQWRQLLHHYYDPMPTVDYYQESFIGKY